MAPAGGRRSSTGLTPNNTNPSPNGTVNVNSKTTGTSEWQFAASNSTLNTWFGGRQPSWLANAKPVKPTPRPPQPPGQPITTETTRPIVATTQPASTPDSPVPISVSTPSPTTTTTTPLPTLQQPRRPPHPLQRPSRPPLQTQTQISTSAPDTVLPSPAPSDEPSPGIVESQSAAPVTSARFVLDTTLDDRREEQESAQSRIRVSTVRKRTTSRQAKKVSTSPRILTPASMARSMPQTPKMPSVGVTEAPPAKRQRADTPAMQFLEARHALQAIRNQIAASGGEVKLGVQVERPRYQLLLDACNEGDLFFITLHQLFCTWSRDRFQINRLCDESIPGRELDAAFGCVASLLKSNSDMRPNHLQWFALFPSPLPHLLKDAVYKPTMGQVFDFLARMAQRWNQVYRGNQERGFPLMMGELLDTFRLYSPILQTIMFRASRRSLGIPDGHLAMQLEAVFRSDQDRHRRADGSTCLLPQAEYQDYHLQLLRSYMSIIPFNNVPQNQSPQLHYQANRQPNAPVPPAVQQPGGLYHPLVSLQMNHQMNQQMNPHMGPRVISIPPTQIHQTHPQMPSLQPVPVQSAMEAPMGPPMEARLNSPAPVRGAPSRCTIPSNQQQTAAPYNPNTHPHQHGAPANQPHLEVPPQPNTHFPTASPQPNLNFVGPYSDSMQSAGQQPQGFQNFIGQFEQLQHNPNLGNQTQHSGRYVPPGPATGLQHAPHFGPQPSQVSQPRQSTVLGDHDRLIPSTATTIGIRDYPHSPYDNRSVQSSLHQVHLRSPKRILQGMGSVKPERYYQAVAGFAFGPVKIIPCQVLSKFTFTISDHEYARITREESRPGHHLPVTFFSRGSLRVRIRTCYRQESSLPFLESDWVTTDTAWPDHIFMELNDSTLSILRKAQHSKDLPAEISSMVRPGHNTLSISLPVGNNFPKGQVPYLAVEWVETLSHSDVMQMVTSRANLPADTMERKVEDRLRKSSGRDADDDELTLVDDCVAINLTDPFTSTIFDIPVRGDGCTHLECFDLETWFNTRLGKKSCSCQNSNCACPKEPSFVDKWRCPICDSDARPYSLRIDGFLVAARIVLETKNKLGTKSILVYSRGDWKPKEEPNDDDSDAGSDGISPPAGNRSRRSATATPFQREKSTIEVVELDDD
ncbi:hypothetical protein F4677DRAFT_448954 [Hypoxylon crocopeplum]|nr:hypothetical protein F4677DRAFT_448954 [Hypoxylon crocopeplum]